MTTPEPLSPTRGLNVLHLFCHVVDVVDRPELSAAIEKARAEGVQIITAALLGAKADVAFMILGEDLWALRRLQSAIRDAGLQISESYVSLTEVSEYAQGMPEAMLNARLYPVLPPEGMSAFCFYPMSKRRGEVHNWYAQDYARREEMMREHGASGKKFRGRVLQLVTGSTGLDDWEWGVTLFALHPDDLKDCVYSMRFDEASTLYGEFGPFYTGLVGDLETVLDAATA